jgi:TrmH family RNA methyltransferase
VEEIISRRNPLCVHVKKLGVSRGYREEHRQFLCDGLKLLEEAVNCGAEVEIVLTASGIPFPLPKNTRVCSVERDLIDSLSQLKSAQDILFVCKMPQESGGCICSKGRHILLDSIQDPGNLGAIIRSANAFEINSVILTGECADPYNPKTVRASMGSIFRQRICSMSLTGLSELKNEHGVRLIGASSDSRSRSITELSPGDCIIAIGNEGSGLSEEILALCDDMIMIPVSRQCESLNAAVAASIIMWEAFGKGR